MTLELQVILEQQVQPVLEILEQQELQVTLVQQVQQVTLEQQEQLVTLEFKVFKV